MTLNGLGSPCVLPVLLVASMSVAIDFDNQAGAETNEVPDVVPEGVLPSELVAADLSAAKARPQQFLRLVRVPSEFSCPFGVDWIASHLSDDRGERVKRARHLHA